MKCYECNKELIITRALCMKCSAEIKVINELNKIENEWINVKDRVPDKTISVLIYNGSFIDIAAYLIQYHFVTDKGSVLDVTHWMPLPEVPKDGY